MMEKKLTYEELKGKHKQFYLLDQLIDTLPSPVYYKDIHGCYLGCNKAFTELIGQTREQIIGKTVFDLLSNEVASIFFERDKELYIKPGTLIYEGRIPDADGVIRNIVFHKATFEDENKGVGGIIVVLTDFTDRAKMEDVHKLDEARLEALLELSQMPAEASLKEITDFALEEAIRLTNSDIGYLAFTNNDESILSMYSWSKKAMKICAIEEKQIDYMTHETGLWGEAIRQRKPLITNDYNAYSPHKKGYPEGHIDIKRHMNIPVFDDGHIVAVAGVGNKEKDYDEADLRQLRLLMQGMWRLIQRKNEDNEKNNLEKQLHKAQRMEALGNLAGGIAHDFNNILFPIIGYTEMILDDIPEGGPFRNKLNEVYGAALRASDLVKQILTFSRQEKGEFKLINIKPIVREVLKLIRATIPSSISITQNIQGDFLVIKADPTQIYQVIMNLATNAYHAMEDTGGELKISLKQIELTEQNPIFSDLSSGDFICLTVADTGTGMHTNVTNKIFDPFFTTKKKGKGTGMGLSVVHGIVKNIGGTIDFSSTPGKGTEFRVYFPIEKSRFKDESLHTHVPVPHGTENILIVDDERGIIDMEQQMLERLGYHVKAYNSSIEALDVFRNSPGKFDLLITDLTMPEMEGDKLIKEMLKIRKNFPIILCTGYSEKLNPDHAEKLGINNILMKPIIKRELAQTIRKVLDKMKGS